MAQLTRLPATLDPAVQAAALAHLRAADAVLARLITAVGPTAVRHEPDYFAALVSAMLGQQISVAAASAIRGRLAARVGPDQPLTPAALLALSHDDLRAIGFSRAKELYLTDLAAKVASGGVDLADVDQLPDEAVIAMLTQIKGIGRWTAEMFLIFSLGRPDVLPVDDQGFRSRVRRHYGLAALPKAAELRALAEPWRPYRTFGTWYLWRSGAVEPLSG
ncbi:MAG TPA: DNA-3-methyladenine glycosylase [Chloroflexota bacterium]|jgi:DNA-3-methyladenine glycosylase II